MSEALVYPKCCINNRTENSNKMQVFKEKFLPCMMVGTGCNGSTAKCLPPCCINNMAKNI